VSAVLRAVAAGVRGGFSSTEVALQWQLGSHAATMRALEALLEAEHLEDAQLRGTRSRERSLWQPSSPEKRVATLPRTPNGLVRDRPTGLALLTAPLTAMIMSRECAQ
jgi:hypothetical protein